MVQYPIELSPDGHPNNGLYLGSGDFVDDFSGPDTVYVTKYSPLAGGGAITDRQVDETHSWQFSIWNKYIYFHTAPNTGQGHQIASIGGVETKNNKLVMGPWTQAVISCGTLGELEFVVDSWTDPTVDIPLIASVSGWPTSTPSVYTSQPWLAMLSYSYDNGSVNGVFYDLYIRQHDWHASNISDFETWTDTLDNGPSYQFSPTIQPGDQLNFFFYSKQTIHLYINGAFASAVHIANTFSRDSEDVGSGEMVYPPELQGPSEWDAVISRWRGFRVGNWTMTIDRFAWTTALTDAALYAREQRFFRPRSLGVT